MTIAWLALNSIKGLGPVRIKSLLDAYGSPEDVFKESRSTLAKMPGLPAEALELFGQPDLFAQAQAQASLCASIGVRILTLADEDYPPLLREIFAPPPVIFVKGQQNVFTGKAIALVGTRRASSYGLSAAAFLAREAVARNLTIVSGLALGIDTAAHRTCLECGGCTIAVLGCGIDRIYPAENTSLAGRIEETGALVSEFPVGTQPESYNFPRRNRLISGLSAGVVVVESGKKGGALITAQYALQQGREVFAVPGSIFSEKSAGANALIKSGATPVRSIDDVLESITAVSPSHQSPAAPNAVVQPALELLTAQERSLLDAMADAPLRLDQLGEKTNVSQGELPALLLNLELRGLVRQRAGHLFERVSAV